MRPQTLLHRSVNNISDSAGMDSGGTASTAYQQLSREHFYNLNHIAITCFNGQKARYPQKLSRTITIIMADRRSMTAPIGASYRSPQVCKINTIICSQGPTSLQFRSCFNKAGDFLPLNVGLSDEKNFPTQRAEARTRSRFSCSHGDQKRPSDRCSPSRQRPQVTDRLIGPVTRRIVHR